MVTKSGRGTHTAGKSAGRSGTRLAVSLALFAGVVFCKLVFPDGLAAMREKVLPLLSESVDYEAALSAAGRLLSGDGRALEEVAANLLPSGEGAAEPVSVTEAPEPETREAAFVQAAGHAAWSRLDEGRAAVFAAMSREPEREEEDESEAEGTEAAVAAFLQTQLDYADFPLPEDVDLSVPELPFAYTAPAEGYSASGFGYREHPLAGVVKYHYGTDIAANFGSEIHAFADGVVYATGESDSTGKYIILDHGDGYRTQYFHCNDVYYYGGEEIRCGQVIAQVGETGNVTGPHLHFELLHDGCYLNPEFYLGVWG